MYDEYEDDYYYYDYFSESDLSSYETEEEYYSEDFEEEIPETNIDESIVDDNIVYTNWKMIRLDDTTLRVSNTGKVQYTDISIFFITNGLKEMGTPYRYVRVGDKKFYVHDLVWRAFNEEDPIPGFIVRHDNAPLDEEGCYSNELRYLTIAEDTIQQNYRIATLST